MYQCHEEDTCPYNLQANDVSNVEELCCIWNHNWQERKRYLLEMGKKYYQKVSKTFIEVWEDFFLNCDHSLKGC